MKNTYTFTAPGPTTTTFSFSDEAAQMAIIELHRTAAEDIGKHTFSPKVQDALPVKDDFLSTSEKQESAEVSMHEYEVAFVRYLKEHHAKGEEFSTDKISEALGLKVKGRKSPGQTIISRRWFKKFFDSERRNERTYRWVRPEREEEFSKFSITKE